MSRRYGSVYQTSISELTREQYLALPDDERREMEAEHAIHSRKFTAERRMAMIDKWPKEMRELAHELGHTIVEQFMACGVRKPNQIRHLVALCRHETTDGRPADFGNTRHRKAYNAVTHHHEDKTLGLPSKYQKASP